MNRLRMILAIALPLALMFAWIINNDWQATHGRKVELKIVGYDPRDLLSGHYLQYRVDYGLEPCPAQDAYIDVQMHCLCLDPQKTPVVATWVGTCDKRPANCQTFLSGHCHRGRWIAGIERFYFPEEDVAKLRTVPAESTIIVILNDRGGGIVTDLKVKGQPLKEWLKSQ